MIISTGPGAGCNDILFSVLEGEKQNGLEQLFAVLMTVMLPWKSWRLQGVCVLLGSEPSCFDLLQLCE